MNAGYGSESTKAVHRTLIEALGESGTYDGVYRALGRDVPLRLVSGWQRRGAETYSLIFEAAGAECETSYILKACIAGYGGHSATVDRWMERRKVILQDGLQVPWLLARSGAVYCEEFIALSLGSALQVEGSHLLITRLATVIRRLARLGFNPSRLDDFRSRGDDVVTVDFGADLTMPWDGDEVRLVRQYAGVGLSSSQKSMLLDAVSEDSV